jgi:hypothetical protein
VANIYIFVLKKVECIGVSTVAREEEVRAAAQRLADVETARAAAERDLQKLTEDLEKTSASLEQAEIDKR